MSTHIGEKEIQQLKDGKWEHLAGRMIIRRRDNTDVIEGPGLIRQMQQEYFQIVIFSPSSARGYKKTLSKLLAGNEKKAGEIIPIGEGYELETSEGWKSKQLGLLGSYPTSDGTIYTTYANEIFNESKRDNPKAKAGVSFTSFHEYKGYPSNKPIRYGEYFEGEGIPGWHLCAAETKAWKYDIRFWVHGGETCLRVTSNRKKKLHNDRIEYRAIEALEFVLGSPVEWNIKRVHDSKMQRIHIRLVPSFPSVRIKQPYHDSWTPGSHSFSCFWNLYSRYLRHILEDEEREYSQIGSLLRNLAFLRSIKHDISTYGLYLSIVIERIVTDYFRREFNDPDMEKLLRRIEKAIRGVLNGTPCELKHRFLSHIGTLSQKTETSKRTLLRLANECKIKQQRIDAWSRLRNKFVHGEKVNVNQELLIDFGNMETLLFQLLFTQIGYQGPYNDYGQLGYPLKEYPKEL